MRIFLRKHLLEFVDSLENRESRGGVANGGDLFAGNGQRLLGDCGANRPDPLPSVLRGLGMSRECFGLMQHRPGNAHRFCLAARCPSHADTSHQDQCYSDPRNARVREDPAEHPFTIQSIPVHANKDADRKKRLALG